MQGTNRTETKATLTSSTKVPDDTLYTDKLHETMRRSDEKELATEWPTSGGGTAKVSSTTSQTVATIYERSSGTSRERNRKQATGRVHIGLNST